MSEQAAKLRRMADELLGYKTILPVLASISAELEALASEPAPAVGEMVSGFWLKCQNDADKRAWKKLLHAAFHILDDSEEDAQTGAISIDNDIAARDLKALSSALDELKVDSHEDIERIFSPASAAMIPVAQVEALRDQCRRAVASFSNTEDRVAKAYGFMADELDFALANAQPAPPAAPEQPDNDKVICPNCVHQFVAIPVNVQKRLSLLERKAHPECPGVTDAALTAEKPDGWDAAAEFVMNHPHTGTDSDRYGQICFKAGVDWERKLFTPQPNPPEPKE